MRTGLASGETRALAIEGTGGGRAVLEIGVDTSTLLASLKPADRNPSTGVPAAGRLT